MSVAKWNAIRAEMNQQFIERDGEIVACQRAFLAGEHVLLLGPPGTSKSAVSNVLTGRITGADYFEYLLTPFTGPEEIFGPYDIPGLEKGKYERVIDGYMPTAHIGFLDEVFKANSAILNSMLKIVNERTFKQGNKWLNVPLISLVGASNETPQEGNLAALYDRFMVRKVTQYVSQGEVVNLLDPNLGKGAGNTQIDLQEWIADRKEVAQVDVPKEVREEISVLKATLEHLKGGGFKASDRRWRASVKLLQACAWLEGRSKVESDDLMVYGDVLWDDMNDAAKCASEVGKIVNPAAQKALEHIDAIDKLLTEFVSAPNNDARIAAKMKINEHKEKLEKLDGKMGGKAKAQLDRVREKEKAAVKKILER